jgi:formylglycine-generating enzyme required for sulfatase activity
VSESALALQTELTLWEGIKDSSNAGLFEDYLRQYPAGRFRALAEDRIGRLRGAPAGAEPSAWSPVPPPAASAGADPPGRRAGSVFRDCPACPELVVIPAGRFRMGSSASEDERLENEGPSHVVAVPSLALGVYEVTVAEFAAYAAQTRVAATGCVAWDGTAWAFDRAKSWRSPWFAQTPQDPVVCVSWEEAQGFVKWLSTRTGQRYRLPSEAEWEYAARAGTTTRRYWGDAASGVCSYANFADETAKRTLGRTTVHPCADEFVYTAPVGRFRGNAFGLYDMLGNAYEWTQDCWHDDYTGAPADGSAWTTGGVTAGWCAAVPGSTNRASCGRPTAAGTPPRSGAVFWVFVWPGCCRSDANALLLLARAVGHRRGRLGGASAGCRCPRVAGRSADAFVDGTADALVIGKQRINAGANVQRRQRGEDDGEGGQGIGTRQRGTRQWHDRSHGPCGGGVRRPHRRGGSRRLLLLRSRCAGCRRKPSRAGGLRRRRHGLRAPMAFPLE